MYVCRLFLECAQYHGDVVVTDDPGGTGSRGTVPRGTRYWPQRPDRIARRTNNVDSLIIIANRVLHQLRDYYLVHVLCTYRSRRHSTYSPSILM